MEPEVSSWVKVLVIRREVSLRRSPLCPPQSPRQTDLSAVKAFNAFGVLERQLPSGVTNQLLVVSLAVADSRYSLSRYVSSLRHAHTGKRRYQSYCQNPFSSLSS